MECLEKTPKSFSVQKSTRRACYEKPWTHISWPVRASPAMSYDEINIFTYIRFYWIIRLAALHSSTIWNPKTLTLKSMIGFLEGTARKSGFRGIEKAKIYSGMLWNSLTCTGNLYLKYDTENFNNVSAFNGNQWTDFH